MTHTKNKGRQNKAQRWLVYKRHDSYIRDMTHIKRHDSYKEQGEAKQGPTKQFSSSCSYTLDIFTAHECDSWGGARF